MKTTSIKNIHFIGIGGIGMSGIAKVLKSLGYNVSGCDLDVNQSTVKELKTLGCHITSGHNNDICKDSSIQMIVHSTAVKESNPEMILAKERNIPIVHRATMLAELMKEKFGIAVSGSHGKTTTTSLISHILIDLKFDPTVIIGGNLKNISSNAQCGNGNVIVVEADESDRSITKLFASIAVITNIDLEHLETYKDLEDIKTTFKQFLKNLSYEGKAIICKDDINLRSILPLENIKTITYGIDFESDIMAKDICINSNNSFFSVWKKNNYFGDIEINLAGRHNIQNCLAAIATCLELNIPFEKIKMSITKFLGIERRFSFQGIYNSVEIYDDYGHHPNEIINTLSVAKKCTKNKLNVVFQPHRYSRTQSLWQQFIDTFSNSNIDNLIITDIYAASEDPIYNVTSECLVQSIKQANPSLNIFYIKLDNDFKFIIEKLNSILEKNDLLLLLGAGKVNKIATQLLG